MKTVLKNQGGFFSSNTFRFFKTILCRLALANG